LEISKVLGPGAGGFGDFGRNVEFSKVECVAALRTGQECVGTKKQNKKGAAPRKKDQKKNKKKALTSNYYV
jgi:hypothetical protein